MHSILHFIETSGQEFLILDGRQPLITTGRVEDELHLFNLTNQRGEVLLAQTGGAIRRALQGVTLQSRIPALSGGQKILLATLFALACPAPKLLFINFFAPLAPAARREAEALVAASGKVVHMESGEAAP